MQLSEPCGGSITLPYRNKKKKKASLRRHSRLRYERVAGSNFGIFLKD